MTAITDDARWRSIRDLLSKLHPCLRQGMRLASGELVVEGEETDHGVGGRPLGTRVYVIELTMGLTYHLQWDGGHWMNNIEFGYSRPSLDSVPDIRHRWTRLMLGEDFAQRLRGESRDVRPSHVLQVGLAAYVDGGGDDPGVEAAAYEAGLLHPTKLVDIEMPADYDGPVPGEDSRTLTTGRKL